MMTFIYNDGNQVTLEVRSGAEHIEKALDDFKTFLHHVGYHADNIEAITYDKGEERQGMQLELFPEDRS